MNKTLFTSAFALGALAVIWMATGFIGSDPLALAVTVVIGAVYTIGIVELMQFRRATATLADALGSASADTELDSWVGRLHNSLQNAVRLRIEGERVGLPAPVFTPYLVGLLVMLGLLGTFVGMVETLQGAVMALEGSTELAAIRSGLAAPIQGLGLAFGTSVAGVATSAMLGLNSTLCRRERMLVTRQLDSAVNSVFRRHSLHHNRQQTYKAMQQQADALPLVAQQMAGMAEKLEQMGERLEQTLISNQAGFLEGAQAQYRDLASSVEQSLKSSLADSAQLAGEAITPVVASAMEAFNASASATQQQLADTVANQLAGIGSHIEAGTAKVGSALEQALQAQRDSNESLLGAIDTTATALGDSFEAANSTLLAAMGETAARIGSDAEHRSSALLENIGSLLQASEGLVLARIDSEQTWAADQEQRMTQITSGLDAALEQLRLAEEQRGSATDERLRQLTDTLQASLETLREAEAHRGAATLERMEQFAATLASSLERLHQAEHERGEAAVARLGDLEQVVSGHLATLGQELEQPMTRLIETASETPRAAAEVIGKLREEVSNNIERDNTLLQERRQVMEQLNGLATSLEQTSGEQQKAVVELVSSSSDLLREMGASLGDRVEGEVAKVADIAAEVAGSAHEVAALGEAFSASVGLFGESNDKLIGSLERMEQALDSSSSRSDEQMGYYVAQAREIIDQSMLSQREIIDELRRLGSTEDLFAAEAG